MFVVKDRYGFGGQTDDPKMITSNEIPFRSVGTVWTNGGAPVTEVASELDLAKVLSFVTSKPLRKIHPTSF